MNANFSYILLLLNPGKVKCERHKATLGLQPLKSNQQEHHICPYVVIQPSVAVMTALDPFIVVITAVPRKVDGT